MTPDTPSPEERPGAGRPAASRVAVVLDEAIVHLAAGESVDAVLARYPDLGPNLRPLLEVAGALQTRAPAPAQVDAVRDRVRERVMLAARTSLRATGDGDDARQRQVGFLAPVIPAPVRWPYLRLGPAQLGGIAAGLAILVFSGGGAVFASGTALPGQPLYPVKLALEDARVAVAQAGADPQAQVSLQTELAGRRLDEAQALAISGQDVPPQVVAAAADHVAVAAAVAEQAPENSRAQLSALVTAAAARRDVAVSRVLERVSPATQQSIAEALENGRGRRPDPRGPGANGEKATAPVATAPVATIPAAPAAPAAPATTVSASTSASGQGEDDDSRRSEGGQGGRGGQAMADDRGSPSGVGGDRDPAGRSDDNARSGTGGRADGDGRADAPRVNDDNGRADDTGRNDGNGRDDGSQGRDARSSPTQNARNAPTPPARPAESRPAENRSPDARPTPAPAEPRAERRNDDDTRPGNDREGGSGRETESEREGGSGQRSAEERGPTGAGRTLPAPTATRVIPPTATRVVPPPAPPAARGASNDGAPGGQSGSSNRSNGVNQGAAGQGGQDDRQDGRANGNDRAGNNGRAAAVPTVTPQRAADNPGRGASSSGSNGGGGGRGRN